MAPTKRPPTILHLVKGQHQVVWYDSKEKMLDELFPPPSVPGCTLRFDRATEKLYCEQSEKCPSPDKACVLNHVPGLGGEPYYFCKCVTIVPDPPDNPT